MTLARQLHYTSCRYSYDKSAGLGFKVRSASGDISSEVLDTVERHSNYRRPLALSDDDNLAAYPVDFQYYPLNAQLAAVTVSHYAGRDYSGRPGNYFSHSLIFDAASLGASAGRLVDWPNWIARLSPGDDEAPPAALPAIELPNGGNHRLEEIEWALAFLNADPRRKSAVPLLTAAVCLQPITGRAVVIRDTPEGRIGWIRTLLALFPWPWARSLTVSSYRFSLSNAVIQCTAADTQIAMDTAERESRYAGADFLQNAFTETLSFNPSEAAVARSIGEAFATLTGEGVAALNDFHTFAPHMFEPGSLDLSFVNVLDCYFLATRRTSILPPQRISPFLAAMAERGNHKDQNGVIAVADNLLNGLSSDDRSRHWPDFAALFATLARDGDPASCLERACGLWFDAFSAGLADAEATRRAIDEFETLTGVLPDVEPRAWEKLTAFTASRVARDSARAWITLLLRMRARLNKPSQDMEAVFGPLALQLCRAGAQDDLVRGLLDDKTALTAVELGGLLLALRGAANGQDDTASGAIHVAVLGVLDGLPEARRNALQNELVTRDEGNLLISAWSQRIRTAKRPQDAFVSLIRGVFEHSLAQNPGSLQLVLGKQVAPRLAAWFPAQSERCQALMQLLDRGWIGLLPRDTIETALAYADATLKIGEKGALERARFIAETAATHGVQLRQDSPRLVLLYDKIVSKGERIAPQEIAAALRGASETNYLAFLRGVLPTALAACTTLEAHRDTIEVFVLSEYEVLFKEAYLATLEAMTRQRDARKQGSTVASYAAALEVWLVRVAYGDEDRAFRDRTREALVVSAGHLKRHEWDEVQSLMKKRETVLTSPVHEAWTALLPHLQNRQRSLTERIGSVFGLLALRPRR